MSEKVRELWTKEKSMSISAGDVSREIEWRDADETTAMMAMRATDGDEQGDEEGDEEGDEGDEGEQ